MTIDVKIIFTTATYALSLLCYQVLGDLNDFILNHRDAELVALKLFMESQKTSLANPRSFAFNIVACLDPAESFKYLKVGVYYVFIHESANLFVTA
jgi:hypothetical protein